jgi:hypothetical protein
MDAGSTNVGGPDAGSTTWVQPPRRDGSLTLDPATLPAPRAPAPDDPAVCATKALPFPDFHPQPDRPCTQAGWGGTATYEYDAAGRVSHRSVHSDHGYEETDTYRYDAAGRLLYRSIHSNSGSGHDEIYTSQDDGVVRVEMLTEDGQTSVDVTEIWDGRPVEADHFDIGADGAFVPRGHATWLYDAQGRQQYVIREPAGYWSREVERTLYDANGHPYFVDQSYYSAGNTRIDQHNFTFRSWFANGVQADVVQTCDIDNSGPGCSMAETRWEPCGNLAYEAYRTGWGLGCFDSSADWRWSADGRPLNNHNRWCDTGGRYFDSSESYDVDPNGTVASGTIRTVNPPGAIVALPEQQKDLYRYDPAGHLIERSLDGKIVFHAGFDDASRLIELGTGSDLVRWTYEGCSR